jgi:hypothetical protein
MQRLTLTIDRTGFAVGDRYAVYGNIDADGTPLDEVDFDNPITGPDPVELWPGVSLVGHLEGGHLEGGHLGAASPPGAAAPPAGGYGEAPHLAGPHLAASAEDAGEVEVVTPRCYFGTYLFAVKTFDAIGNASAGTPVETEIVVNSGPDPVRAFRQTGVSGGRPVFGFTPPPQLG